MQLALFPQPPNAPDARRRPSVPKGARRLRSRLPDGPPPTSNPKLSFWSGTTEEKGRGDVDLEPAKPTMETRPHPSRGKTFTPEVLSADEVRALMRACSNRAVTGIRNRALLGILWRTGMRIAEALDLMPHDVDAERGTVRVREGKGLKPRTTVLSNLDCLRPLTEWVRLRQGLSALTNTSPLFCTLRGTTVETSYIRHLMPRLARRAAIRRRVHAHALRHTHTADLALAGAHVLAIQQQLGHASLVTTADYLRRVGVPLEMLESIRPQAPNIGPCW